MLFRILVILKAILMVKQFELTLAPRKRGYHLITHEIESKLSGELKNGIINLSLQHTSAALTLNENADPDVRVDFESFMDKLVPDGDRVFIHTLEGPDDMSAHLKSSLLGASLTIPVVSGRLKLGTWQGIYLCEFRDHATPRRIFATFIGE
jgi:secondary thiamine-phosphate synthase enzyme